MRREIVVLAALVPLASLAGCRRESRRFEEPTYLTMGAAGFRVDEAPMLAAPEPGGPGQYRGNAWAISQGQQLYNVMNCVGCHSHGGGGMGPPLMDNKWIYGSEPSTIFDTIVNGRPNGMPAWRGRLSDQQVWQLVAYVRTLSGLQPDDAMSPRDDHMAVRPAPNRMKVLPPVKQETP